MIGKFLSISCLLVLSSSISVANSKSHFHGSRTHDHSLPKEGIKHKHGKHPTGSLTSVVTIPATTQHIPRFFDGDQCDALATWVRPLQLEFPEKKWRRESEISVKAVYKLLFSDDYFAPVFGKPIDALSDSQLKVIGKSLGASTRNCKKRNSSDVSFLISLYPGAFLSRPFNRQLKRTPFSYTFVVTHAQARRKILAPLRLGSDSKPTTEQLIQIANQNKSIFHLLWPSEKSKIVTYEQPPVKSDAQSIVRFNSSQPQGKWFGLALCRRRDYQEMSVNIQRLPGRISGEMRSYKAFEFELIPAGNGVYDIRSKSRVFGKKATIKRSHDLPELLSMKIHGGCSKLIAIRFQPIEGLGGRYAKVSDQESFCKDVVDSWFYMALDRLGTAKRLKEEFYPVLNDYDVKLATSNALFSDTVINDYFGMTSKQMGSKRLASLKRQVSGCVLMNPPDGIGIRRFSSFFVPTSVNKVRNRLFRNSSQANAASLQSTKAFDYFISGKETKTLSASSLAALFSGWSALVQAKSSVPVLESFIRERASGLDKYDPADVKQILYPIAKQLRVARIERHKGNNAEQMEKYKQLLKSAHIPYQKIEVPYRKILKSLANGKPVQFDSANQLFFGGLATYYLKECKNTLSTSERFRIIQFTTSSSLRAMLGADYSNSNIGQSMKERATGQVIFVGGRSTALVIGCGSVDPMLELVADMVRSNETSDEGGEPLFIKSCAPVHGLTKCKCLAKVGISVIPNINNRRYSGNVIREIIKKNPLAGMMVIGCGISRY